MDLVQRTPSLRLRKGKVFDSLKWIQSTPVDSQAAMKMMAKHLGTIV
jgi:hypothetical protein